MLITLFFIPLIGALFSILSGFFVIFLFFDIPLLSFIPSSQDGLESFLVPIMIYSNANSDKSIILSDNKNRAGVYMWTHLESGKIYVGSAHDLSKRLRKYYSPLELKRANNYICNALISHSHSAFSLTILEIIDISNLTKKETRELILEREQFYLDSLLPGYNILKIAGSSLGNVLSDEVKALMSEAKLGVNHPMYGKSHTAIAKALMSEAKIGEKNPNFNKSPSIETRAKLRIARGIAIYVYDSGERLTFNFSSTREAAKYFKCSKGTILKFAKDGKLFKNEWILSLDKK